MSEELFYTSAPRGLKPGSQGFCTVAASAGMSALLVDKLEKLSVYRHLLPPENPDNPVGWSHIRVSAGNGVVSVLSRIGPAGLDYSGRGNMLAHHLVLDAGEISPAGPAWLLSQRGLLDSTFEGGPRHLSNRRRVPMGDQPPAVCKAWQQMTDDAGWAGVLAEAFEKDPSRPVYLVFNPDQELLPLLTEAIALLPPHKRWQVTFSTYYTEGLGTNCVWRCVPKNSKEEKEARRSKGLMLDLTGALGMAVGGALVEQARTGRRQQDSAAAGNGAGWESAPPVRALHAAATSTSHPRGAALTAVPMKAAAVATEEAPGAVAPPSPPSKSRKSYFLVGVLAGAIGTTALVFGLSAFSLIKLGYLGKDLDQRAHDIDRLTQQAEDLERQMDSATQRLAQLGRDQKDAENQIGITRANLGKLKEEQTAEKNKLEKLTKEEIPRKAKEIQALENELDRLRKDKKDDLARADTVKRLPEVLKKSSRGFLLFANSINDYVNGANRSDAALLKNLGKWYRLQVEVEIEAENVRKGILDGPVKSMPTSLDRWDKVKYPDSVVKQKDKEYHHNQFWQAAEKLVKKCTDLNGKYRGTVAADKLFADGRLKSAFDSIQHANKIMPDADVLLLRDKGTREKDARDKVQKDWEGMGIPEIAQRAKKLWEDIQGR